jgi:hypothetical protein
MHLDPIAGGGVHALEIPATTDIWLVESLPQLAQLSQQVRKANAKPALPPMVRPTVGAKFDDVRQALETALESHWQNACRAVTKKELPEVLSMLTGKICNSVNDAVRTLNTTRELVGRLEGRKVTPIQTISGDAVKALLTEAVRVPEDLARRQRLPSLLAQMVVGSDDVAHSDPVS